MALEAVVFQQEHIFGYNVKDLSNVLVEEETPLYDLQGSLDFLGNQTENFDVSFPQDHDYYWSVPQDSPGILVDDLKIPNSYSSNSSDYQDLYNSSCKEQQQQQQQQQRREEEEDRETIALQVNRAKKRRSRTRKNKEEIENQRMTHIAVERNRRKQMNEYLSVLRSLMPESYVQRGDQASIVGGAINFVRELEHRLHRLNVHGDSKERDVSGGSSAAPFAGAFKFPQFTMESRGGEGGENTFLEGNALADVEVSLVESHASLKIRSKRRPKLLLNVVSGLQSLGFVILHLNVSTADDFVLYCFSTKVEDDCNLTSVADIATAVYQMLCAIHQQDVK